MAQTNIGKRLGRLEGLDKAQGSRTGYQAMVEAVNSLKQDRSYRHGNTAKPPPKGAALLCCH